MNDGNIRSLGEKLVREADRLDWGARERDLTAKLNAREQRIVTAVDAVLAWWDQHKNDTYTYQMGGYAYDGDTFDADAASVFENLRTARDS